ncbi:MAG: HEAT repeat domain-containing protein [Chitinivibrionales bacterium]|nr:HEAT repeat domain-containing protein [Chitinivibrionales bacterium]
MMAKQFPVTNYRQWFYGVSVCAVMLVACAATPNKKVVNLKSSDVALRREAVIAVGQQGPEAQYAVNDLLMIAVKDEDAEVRRLAIESIGYVKPSLTVELVDAMVLCINDEDVHIRRAAIIAIGNFDNMPPNLVTMLQKRLGDNDRLVRELATSVFERIGKLGVRALVRALADPNTEMRLNAALILGRLGENAQLALTELKKVEETDESEEVRRAAGQAVIYITKFLQPDTVSVDDSDE